MVKACPLCVGEVGAWWKPVLCVQEKWVHGDSLSSLCAGASQQQQDGGVERKSTAKLTEILDIERQVQQRWEAEKIFEEDAPKPGTPAAKYAGWVLWQDDKIKCFSCIV